MVVSVEYVAATEVTTPADTRRSAMSAFIVVVEHSDWREVAA
jgi:hypothetical protein